MSTKILSKKKIEQYNKKYRHNINLVKFTKTDVLNFDKQHNCVGENRLLKNRTWWLIDNTYYEVPKTLGHYWFRNLNIGIQISVCTLLGLSIAGGAASGYLFGYYNKVIEVDSSSSDKIDIVSVKTNSNGDKIIETKGKAGSTPTISIDVYKGKDKLVKDEEYIYTTANAEKDKYIITVYKKALDKHFGPLKIVSNNQKQIVVKPNVVNIKLGDKIHLDAYVDNEKIECTFLQKGDQCLSHDGEGNFEAVIVGHGELWAQKRGYAKAVVPVTVTTDKNIIITPETTTNKKVGEDVDISASLDTGETAKFTFTPIGSCVSISSSTDTTAKIHVKKAGLASVLVTTGVYYKYYNFWVDHIVVSGERNISIPSTATTYNFTSDAYQGGVTWSLDSNITSEEATIDSTTGVLTVKPGINRAISTFVNAQKEDEIVKYNIIIASFDKLDFIVNRQDEYCLVKSKEDGSGVKSATGDIYLPTSYFDSQLKDYVEVVGFAYDEEKQKGAFEGTSITSITLTSNIESISNNAFKGCASLTNLVIPGSVETIGTNIIDGCSSLTGVTFNGSTPWIIHSDNKLIGFTPSDTPSENLTTLNNYKNCQFTISGLRIDGEVNIKEGAESKLSTSKENTVWSVQDSSIATIDETGKLKGVKEGKTYVFAIANDRIGTKLVTVTK